MLEPGATIIFDTETTEPVYSLALQRGGVATSEQFSRVAYVRDGVVLGQLW